MDISRGQTSSVLGEVAQIVIGLTNPRSKNGRWGSTGGSRIASVALVEMIPVEAIPPAEAGGGLRRCWKRSLGASVDVRAHPADIRIARVLSSATGTAGDCWPCGVRPSLASTIGSRAAPKVEAKEAEMASPVCWTRAAPSSAAKCIGAFDDEASISLAFFLVMLKCVAVPAATTKFENGSQHEQERKRKTRKPFGRFLVPSAALSPSISNYLSLYICIYIIQNANVKPLTFCFLSVLFQIHHSRHVATK